MSRSDSQREFDMKGTLADLLAHVEIKHTEEHGYVVSHRRTGQWLLKGFDTSAAALTLLKTLTLVVLVLVALSSPALAQEQTTTLPAPDALVWNGYEETTLPPAPCTFVDVDFKEFQNRLWALYTCRDGRIIGRRFTEPTSRPTLTFPIPGFPRVGVPPRPRAPEVLPCDTTDTNWQGTGGTECQWRARYPVPGVIHVSVQ
jgi:hypothetical protein